MWLVRAAIDTRAATQSASRASLLAEREVQVVEVEKVVEQPTIDILVADRPIRIGSMLSPADFRWQPWPENALSEFYITRGEANLSDMLDGAAARLPLVSDQPLTEENFVKIETAGVMSALLRDGMRAVAVPISELTGAGGFVNPGDFVDLLLTRQFEIKHYNDDSGAIERTEHHQRIDTVLGTVRVLAIDQSLQGPDNGVASRNIRTATLELTPEQTELIALTRQIAVTERGEISLSLHSFSDLVRKHGQDLDKIRPVTVLDLRQEAIRKQEEAERNRIEASARRARQRAMEATQRAAAENVRLEREQQESQLRREALELQIQRERERAERERVAREQAEAEHARREQTAAAAAAAQAAQAAQTAQQGGAAATPNRVTLLRGGAPISVYVRQQGQNVRGVRQEVGQ